MVSPAPTTDHVPTPDNARAALAAAGFDARAAAAVLALVHEPAQLADAWHDYQTRVPAADAAHFALAVTTAVGRDCRVCADCSEPAWTEDGGRPARGAFVCDECLSDYHRCDRCDALQHQEDTTAVGDLVYCDGCLSYCCSFCEECDEWYHDGDSDDHDHDDSCGCEAPNLRFCFPNRSGRCADNERVEVDLPAGTIDPEGIDQIVQQLCVDLAAADTTVRDEVARTVASLDPRWQTTRGNFTRRLSSELYNRHGIKLPAGALAEVGNVARRHTANSNTWLIEFTRDLNRAPDAFYNYDSCWWGSEGASLCALKSWGGMALRSYQSRSDHADAPAGRAWVQPLRGDLQPTHDALGAHAYLVYNGYGNLEGSAGARLIAHLTGRSYRKVSTSLIPQYVNGSSAYLVADQATCNKVAHVSVHYDRHAQLDASHANLDVAA